MPASGTVCAVGRRIGIDIGIEIAVMAAATVREVEIGGGGIWICS
jgi:hypothetical protein